MAILNTKTKNIFLWLGDIPGREKITIGTGENGVHYTVLFWGDRRVIDIHKTIEKNDQVVKAHENITEISYFAAARLLISFSKINSDLLLKNLFSQKINTGKLKRHHLICTAMQPDKANDHLFVQVKKKKNIRPAKSIDTDTFSKLFLRPGQLDEDKANSYWLFSEKNHQLQGFIIRQPHSLRSFYFVSKANFKEYRHLSEKALLQILTSLEFKNKQKVLELLGAA